jgi:hypothetical protein
MKLQDALVYELIKPTRLGEPTGAIINVVGTKNIKYVIEEPHEFQQRATHSIETIVEQMTPDLVVTRLRPQQGEQVTVVIEVETDVDFDFGASMRQIKKYRKISREIHVIIPRAEENFAPLYRNEGFRVWLWEATRIWECMRCGAVKEENKILQPRCSETSCRSSEQRLKGLKNAKFADFGQ